MSPVPCPLFPASPHSHVAHGRYIGYNLKKRANDPCYQVYFRGIDGRRLERDTQHAAMRRAWDAAHAIIEKEYEPGTATRETVSWDDAARLLKEKAAADGRRNPTIDYYQNLIRRIRKFYSVTTGPADSRARLLLGSWVAQWRLQCKLEKASREMEELSAYVWELDEAKERMLVRLEQTDPQPAESRVH